MIDTLRTLYHSLQKKKDTVKNDFTNSHDYWLKRYESGGNSGCGSYDHLAEFKAEIINNFVSENKINEVIEFGCGDGNQLQYFRFKKYTGFDISPDSIRICREKFKNDLSKNFKLTKDFNEDKAELILSLDVIFHLIEDDVFDNYMNNLFKASRSFVIIYSSNKNENSHNASHVKHRKFTDWISQNTPYFNLVEHIPNKYPYNGDYTQTSFADFYIFRNENVS